MAKSGAYYGHAGSISLDDARRGGTRFGPSDAVQLTLRQQEVLLQLARGLTIAQSARLLHLSHHTVKCHIHRLLQLTGTNNRAHLIVWAYETGTITPLYLRRA